jgi:hypothetical protein
MSVKKHFLMFIIVILTNSYAQNILWMKRYDLSQNEYCWRTAKDSSENIISAGYQENIAGTSSDILVLKCNSSGDTLWYRRYDIGQIDWTTGVITDQIGNIIIASFEVTTEIPGLIKLSPGGDTIWTKMYPAMNHILFTGITLDSQNNIIACGFSTTNYSDIVKFDTLGNPIWTRTYYNLDPSFSAIVLDTAENIFLSGVLFYNPSCSPLFVAKLNNNGDSIWMQTYTTGRWITDGTKIKIDHAGNIVISGYDGDGYNSYDALIIKYSPTGSMLWNRFLNFHAVDVSAGVDIDTINNIFVAGYSGMWNSSDYFLVKCSSSGETLWTRFYDGGYDDQSGGVVLDRQGNPIVSGSSSNGTNYDILIIKYSGSSGIEIPSSNIVQSEEFVRLSSNIIRNQQVQLSIIKPSGYQITLYDIQGRKVRVLQDGFLKQGEHFFNLSSITSGIYFLKIKTENYDATKKIVLVR